MRAKEMIKKIWPAIFLFIALHITNCHSEKSKVDSGLKPSVQSKPERWDSLSVLNDLDESWKDSLLVACSFDHRDTLYFGRTKSFCQYSNDTLVLNFVAGYGPHYYLRIKLINDKYNLFLRKSDCIYSFESKSISQSLKVFPFAVKAGDSLMLSLHFKSWGIDSGTKISDTVLIDGRIKVAIRHKGYTYDNLQFENDSIEMVNLLASKTPEKIDEVEFLRCGLKEIPKELAKFKNLEYLTIMLNDLGNANFEVLKNLKKLKYISMKHCRVNKFPMTLLELKELEEINLSSNNLTSIPVDIYKMKSLQELNLKYNKELDSNQVIRDNAGRIKSIGLTGTK